MNDKNIVNKKQEIISCEKYPNCNAFKKDLGVGDTVCNKAMLCQIHMNYISYIEELIGNTEGKTKINSKYIDAFKKMTIEEI